MDDESQARRDESLAALASSFRAMAENVPGALFRYVVRPDGSSAVEYMSPRCLELWELPAEEIVDDASRLWQMVDPADLPAMQQSVMRSAQTLEPWTFEWRITTPSGKRKWLEGRGRPERLPDGSVLWNSLILDVTERRRVDEALRASERRLAEVMAASGEAIWHYDIAADRVSHNRRWCEMLGVGDEYLEHPMAAFAALVHPDDLAPLMRRVRRCLDDGVPQHSEYRMVRPDGRVIWVVDRGDVVERDAEGRARRMAGSMSDITARKQAELELRVKDAAIESSLNGIALAGLDGHLTYVNPAFCRLWGVDAAQALGRSALDFWRVPGEPEAVIAHLLQLGSWSGEMKGERGDGSTFDVEVSAALVRDPGGQPLCLMGSFVDVTERRRAEAALRELNDDLERRIEQRTADLALAKAEAERANLAKSEFLARMSHELRTPMNAVLGFAQLLELDAGLSARARDWLREILRAGHHLLELINEVLDLAGVEAGRIRLSLEPVELAPIIDETLALHGPMAARGRVSLPAQAPAGPIVLQADRTRLKQVLMNLLSNAIKYNRPGGRVELDVGEVDGHRWRVTVRDTGQGLTPAQQSELFKPFQRLTDDASIEGTGIGLVITRRLVELMGGSLGVASEPGRGSAFWFELPAATAPGEATPRTVAPAPTGAAADVKARVLYVDDNPANLRLVAELLARRPGIELLTAPSAGLGLDLAQAHRPSLILLDLQLPGVDGYQMLALLCEHPTLRDVPVVAVTSQAYPRDVERGLAMGFADYVVKPIVVADLLAAVDRLLARAPGS